MAEKGIENKETYFVAVKVFLERESEFLIFKDGYGQWDLPGGRIKKDEFGVPLEEIVKRKMAEELGDGVQYVIGKPIVFMRHERVEHAPGNPTVRIFAVGFPAEYTGGDINLASHHKEVLWANVQDFEPERYFTGGWLSGVQDYLRLRRADL